MSNSNLRDPRTDGPIDRDDLSTDPTRSSTATASSSSGDRSRDGRCRNRRNLTVNEVTVGQVLAGWACTCARNRGEEKEGDKSLMSPGQGNCVDLERAIVII